MEKKQMKKKQIQNTHTQMLKEKYEKPNDKQINSQIKISRKFRVYRLKKKARKISKASISRKNIIKEIIKTEEGYCEDLRVMAHEVMPKILRKNLMTRKQSQTIFSNINTIYPINCHLLKGLKETVATVIPPQNNTNGLLGPPPPPPITHGKKGKKGLHKFFDLTPRRSSKSSKEHGKNPIPTSLIGPRETIKTRVSVGQVFFKFTPFLKVYTTYITGYSDAADCLRELKNSSPGFETFLKSQKKHNGHGLASYLIKPIQRVPRYQLLLRELIKYTPKEHWDMKNLEASYKLVINVANHLNEQTKMKDSQRIFKQVHRQFWDYLKDETLEKHNSQIKLELENTKSLEDQKKLKKQTFSIVQPHRIIIKDGPLTVKEISNDKTFECDCYLFTDIFLIIQKDAGDFVEEEGKEGNNGGKDTHSRGDLFRFFMHLCFLQLKEHTGNTIILTNSIGKLEFSMKASTKESAEKWYTLLESARNNEVRKLIKSHNVLSNVNITELVYKKENLQAILPIKKKEYKIILKALHENLGKKEEKRNRANEKIKKANHLVSEIDLLYRDISAIDVIANDCFRRSKRAHQIFSELKLTCDGVDNKISMYMRGEQRMTDKYFGKNVGFDDLNLEKNSPEEMDKLKKKHDEDGNEEANFVSREVRDRLTVDLKNLESKYVDLNEKNKELEEIKNKNATSIEELEAKLKNQTEELEKLRIMRLKDQGKIEELTETIDDMKDAMAVVEKAQSLRFKPKEKIVYKERIVYRDRPGKGAESKSKPQRSEKKVSTSQKKTHESRGKRTSFLSKLKMFENKSSTTYNLGKTLYAKKRKNNSSRDAEKENRKLKKRLKETMEKLQKLEKK